MEITLSGGGACPEQYEARIGDRIVGYIRLRFGEFRLDCPDCGDETVLSMDIPESDGGHEFLGEFPNDCIRSKYLDIAKAGIYKWLETRG